MTHGSRKYRLMMANLDKVGVTTNIVRVGPKWYELHVNYEIRKKARKRNTCNHQLERLAMSLLPPPLYGK